MKIIKDHHKPIAIVNVKFCDWAGPPPPTGTTNKLFSGFVDKIKTKAAQAGINPRESVRFDRGGLGS